MDFDSSPPPSLSPRHRIIQRLALTGVPEEDLEDLQLGLVRFIKNNKHRLSDIISAVLPADLDISEVVSEGKFGSNKASDHPSLKDVYRESMLWIKWLMFEQEPSAALINLTNLSVGQRGVCGAIWGKNDLAFRCRTCEHDPTCAICVPCFQNGNHKNHDYSIIYTGGGCCDCGDETAWKREGFCSKHKGAEQIQPLPDDIANSIGPVLDDLFSYWKNKLLVAENMSRGDSTSKYDVEPRKVASDYSYVVVEMLLNFCNHCESLLSFISKRLIGTVDFLPLLLRAERFISTDVTKKLHELLLKLLGEPFFKYEFAKVFIDYYPTPVAEVLRTSSDNVLRKYPLLPMFAVQIFTVPTLTPRLVKERNLLAMLLECLGEIIFSCCGEDGQFQFNKWFGVFDTCIRVMEDIRFVLSHSIVAKYVTHERSDIVKVWLQILSLVQGLNPLKRETSIHVEEEQENAHLPFIMCNSIATIHLLLVKGAFSVADSDEEASFEIEQNTTEDGYSQRHAKVGRLSEESSICSSAGHSSISTSASQNFQDNSDFVVLPSVLQLIFESTKAIDCWLAGSNVVSHVTSDISCSKLLIFKEALVRAKKGLNILGSSDSSSEINDLSNPVISDDEKAQPATHACPMDTGLTYNDASIVETEISAEKDALSLLCLSDWPNIDYDVSSQEISVHMPLHGLLSLNLKEVLRHCYGESGLTDKGHFIHLNPLSSDHLDFFRKVLRGCHPYGFSSFMMEHPLQSRVFCSQVRAGMWRKNGDAAIFCFNWYRSIRWSDHVLELDLFLLQFCAAFAPADLCVRRILERFQLSNYLALDLKRSSEYEPVLMQELLTLVIQIVKERRFCGLTASQSLQRELVCKLATGDATHSELIKSLPKDLSKLDQLQEVLDKIAHYSNPSGMNQGKYSLRESYWKELDLYHPCWNPRDLQVAEERYSRFCGVSALSAQLPKWISIYQPLVGIARVATCKTALQVIRAVLVYAVFTDRSAESRAPDGVLIPALHLLALALDICTLERTSGHQPVHDGHCNTLVAVAAEEIEVGLHNKSGHQSLLSLLVLLMRMHKKESTGNATEAGSFKMSSLVEILLKKFGELDSRCMTKLQQLAPETVDYNVDETVNISSTSDTEKRKMKARERQAAILAKMKAEQSKFLATLKSSADEGSHDLGFQKEEHAPDVHQESEEMHVCCLCHDPNSRDPVSFLILLQKSRIVNFVDKGPPSWDQGLQSDELESSVLVHDRTESSIRGANAVAVESFSSSNLVESAAGAVDEFAAQAHPEELSALVDYLKSQFPELRKVKVRGKSAEKRDKTAYPLELLEQDLFLSIHKEIGSIDSSDFPRDVERISSGENAARSLLLGKYIAAVAKDSKEPSHNGSLRRVEPALQIPSSEHFGPSDCDGIHVSSCGHAVHQGCLDRYLSSLKERLIRRMVFEGGHIVDPDQGEFLCPVCRRLANSTLSAVPGDSYKLWEQYADISSAHSFGSLTKLKEESGSWRLGYGLSMIQTAASIVSRGEMLKALPMQRSGRIGPSLEPVFQLLSGMYSSGKQDTFSRPGRVSPSVLMWATLSYSLVSTEIAARCGKCSLTARKGLSCLNDEFRSSGGFILPLLLRIIQSTRSKNVIDLLLRFRGLQLFSTSICSGITYAKYHEGANSGEGKILRMLRHTDGEIVYPDMQFWDQASHPILIHDPFSTLMWLLFCLPHPFLSSKESFLSLVHIFYGVSVIQAIITYCLYSHNINDLGFHDCLVTDIAKLAGNSAVIKKLFVSNYIDPSCHIKDVIDNLSLPYLRRCFLLWKLLKCSATSPSHSRVGDFDKSLDISDCQETSDTLGDTDEINELRNIFEIPLLDILLNDGSLRSMTSKWFHHLCKEFENQCVQHPLHLTPVVPFQLMRLPVIYQDLVQRYIKVRCPSCDSVQDEPALCLLCGRLCSPVWKSCCSESGCQAHAESCGAGTGVFLLIRKTTILLQRNARQAPWPSPYLDAFGEEDVDMHRGKPLYLNEERYAALTYMVASHGLDRTSKVLRQTTIGTFFMV